MPVELKRRGYFYRPDNHAQMIAGELRADEVGIAVDLDGTFQQPAELPGVRAAYPVMHARLADGKAASLYGVYQSETHIGAYLRESWTVTYCVLGELLPENPTFDTMHFELDHLPDWFARTGLSVHAGQDGPRSLRITSSPPEDLQATLDDGNVVAIGFGGNLHREHHLHQIRERIIGRVECSPALSSRDLTDRYLVPLRDLITFATLAPAVVEEVSVQTPLHTVPTTSGGTIEVPMPIFLPLLQPERDLRIPPPLRPDRMLFRFDDWPGTFDDLMRSWWRLRAEQSAAVSILLGLRYAPPRWSDSRALAWAQAFEAYHRIQFRQSSATTQAKERHERVLGSSPKGDRQWLRVRLEHADEPSLRGRVKEVCRRVAAIVDPLLTQHPDFASRLSEIRNLYAHFGALPETAGGASGTELYVLAEVAEWVFLANVLLDLGFKRGKVKELVQRNEYFKWLVENPQPIPLG